MAGLEEMMAGLFGNNEAAGLEETRRRRSAPGAGGGYEGIGGSMVTPGQMMPYWGGIGQYDFSGASGGVLERGLGRQGLMSLLADVQGPALRHFQRQGFDFMPPGQDNREQPGGPNVAPGNIDNGQALDQPQGNLTPGVPRGVAVGQSPGQVQPRPQTQGWRNLAAGYSAAAAYGTDPYGRPIGFSGGGRPVGAPAAQSGIAPGGPPGGRPQGPAGAGGPPRSGGQNPIGGGVSNVAPAAGPGAGQGTGGGGGKKSGGAPAGVTPQVKAQAAGQSTARGGVPQAQFADQKAAGNIAKGAGKKNLGGSPMLDALGAIQDLGNQPKPPNKGNNNTPSELGGQFSSETTAERKARLAAKAARQEAKVQKQVNAQTKAGNSNNTPSELGYNTTAGKTKPKPKVGKITKSGFQTGGGF